MPTLCSLDEGISQIITPLSNCLTCLPYCTLKERDGVGDCVEGGEPGDSGRFIFLAKLRMRIANRVGYMIVFLFKSMAACTMDKTNYAIYAAAWYLSATKYYCHCHTVLPINNERFVA